MGDSYYVEFVVDSPYNRGLFIPEERLGAFIAANIDRVMFHSYWKFDKTIIEHHKKHNTLKGYNGTPYPFRFILDIDGEESDLETTAGITNEIVSMLIHAYDIDESNIQTWFSGSKGFHIHMPNLFGFESSPGLSNTVKTTFQAFFKKWDKYIDYKPLMSTGLIRTGWSLNTKTNLFKIPVSHGDLIQIANSNMDITAIAIKERMFSKRDVIAEGLNNDNNGLLSSHIIKQSASKNWAQLHKIDTPSNVVTCMQKLALRGPISGRRHKDALRLVSSWRRHGILPSLAKAMLFEWLDISDNDSEATEYVGIIESVYNQSYAYSCKDEVMTEFCDSNCIFYKNKDYIMEVQSGMSLQRNLREYMESSATGSIDIAGNFGFREKYEIAPGDLLVITGDTGAGKSALVQNILDQAGRPTLYFNLEMKEQLVYRRFLQIHYDKTKHQIAQDVYDGIDFSDEMPWLNIVSTNPTIDAVERLVKQRNYDIIVVDTTDGVEASGSDYAKLGTIVNTLRNIAQNMGKIVIIIHHLRKRSDPSKLIRLDDLSGNRAIVTKMDHVFALEVEGNRRILRMLKTRDQQPIILNFNFNFSTFNYEPDANFRPNTLISLDAGSSG